MKSIEMCTNRFDDDTKNSFVELYTKVDAGASADQIMDQQKKAELESQMNPMIVRRVMRKNPIQSKSINHSVSPKEFASVASLINTRTKKENFITSL